VLTPLIEQARMGRVLLVAGVSGENSGWHALKRVSDASKCSRGAAGGLAGQILVVYEPTAGLVSDVFPCEDGHAQERSMLGQC